MKDFVLDCSVAMAWCFEDESHELADQALLYLTDENNPCKAIVPPLWYLEVANVLGVAERKSRLTAAESLHFLDLLATLPIETDITCYLPKDVLTITRAYGLSAYDSNYLLLALNLELPLATLDLKLVQAAKGAHLSLLF